MATDKTSKHTPGPWKQAADNKGLILDSQNKTIAQCFSVNTTSPGDEVEANIPLIAAAPELLEALKLLYRRAQEAGIGNDFWPSDGFESAERAIAKAEGKGE